MNKRKHLSDEQKQYIIAELKKQRSVNEIKKELNIGCNRINRLIKEEQITYDAKKFQSNDGVITEIFKTYFIENSTASNIAINRAIKKHNLLDFDHCNNCGISDWLGQKIKLDLDHINGNNCDNRIKNLRYLCPNCHSLTPTYKKGNYKGVQKVSDEQLIKAIKSEPNIRQALRKVGLTPKGGNYDRVYHLKEKFKI